ncbi:MAG TPA: methyltransferase domain-containing protein [Nocardioidaceae bacterium]|nr:methyltransferase domain-containing protein [Nocardioidaceae bacterium]
MHDHEDGQADLLDLDAEVFGSHLDDVTEWAAQHAARPIHRTADMGAGTGTGTLALARRFPDADVVAIDSSAPMLERLQAMTRAEGLADRVRVVQADLDVAWPEVTALDLAWAALSLHHVADPDRVLRDVLTALKPGGLLVVLEMDDLPRFLAEDVGQGRPGLEERCHAAMARAGWNSHPDWRPHLERAGFEIAGQRTFEIEADPASPSIERYARGLLSNIRSGLDDQLSTDDLDTLDHLLVDDDPHAVLRRQLTMRSSRTAWVAQRPDEQPTEPAVHEDRLDER